MYVVGVIRSNRNTTEFGEEIKGDNHVDNLNIKSLNGNNYGKGCKIISIIGNNHGDKCNIYKITGNQYGSYCAIYELTGVCKGTFNVIGKKGDAKIMGLKNRINPSDNRIKEMDSISYRSMIASNDESASYKIQKNSKESPENKNLNRIDCAYTFIKNQSCLICLCEQPSAIVVCSPITSHYGICYDCAKKLNGKCFVCRTFGIRIYKKISSPGSLSTHCNSSTSSTSSSTLKRKEIDD